MRSGRVLLIAAIFFLSVFLQVTVARQIGISGVSPDLFLAILVAFALCDGSTGGAAFGLCGGLILDVFGGHPIGFFVVQYTLIGAGCGLLARSRYVDRIVMPALLSGVAYLFLQLVALTYLYLQRVTLVAEVVTIKAAIGTAYTTLIGVALYQAFRLLYSTSLFRTITHSDT